MAKFYWCISLVLVACSAVLVQGDAELEAAWKEFQVITFEQMQLAYLFFGSQNINGKPHFRPSIP